MSESKSHADNGVKVSLVKLHQKDLESALYSLAIEMADTGFFIYNAKEGLISSNSMFFELLGFTSTNKVSEHQLRNIDVTDEKCNFIELLNKLIINTTGKDYTCRIINSTDRDKTTAYLKFRIKHLKKNKFFGIVTNITEAKKKEEELTKAKESAEAADKLKTTFLTNFSHEIRTPMNSIIGFTELLNIGDHTPEQREEYLSIIKLKSKSLLNLIDDIVELAKFESGAVTITKGETNLAKLMSDLQQEYYTQKELIKKTQVELFMSLPADNSYNILFTDAGRVHQVLAYILDNALQYTEKGYIQFGYELKDPKHLLFYVKDTGVGISKEKQRYIFQKLKYREDTIQFSDMQKGLSLTIAKSIVEALGGKISVESNINEGSNFYFTLPISKPVILKPEPNKIPVFPNWKNKVILVAEDEEMNFKFIEAVLSSTQAQLIHVNDGQQAVELCKNLSKIDLILMDIKMPEMNGYDAIKEIRKIREHVPIIAQTAYTFKEDRARCIEAGCNDFISKPIDVNLLIQKMNKHLTD